MSDASPVPAYNPEQVLSLESTLNERILGQEPAIKQISKVLLNSAAGFRDAKKPRGIFLLTGPSGVGKTETALALAAPDVFYPSYSKEELKHYNPGHHIINMGEYQQSHEVAKLIGSPPGYTGDSIPLAMSVVNERPRTVFILDEIEKAHPAILDALLAPFDKGKMNTGKNVPLDFKDAIFMMTSNHPAPDSILRKEFLNRVDAVVKFHPLQKEHYKTLIERKIADTSATMVERYGTALSMEPTEIDRFAMLLAQQENISRKPTSSKPIGFAHMIQKDKAPSNPLMTDSSNEIQAGTGAREMTRIFEKSLEPITRHLFIEQARTAPDTLHPNRIVIKDLFHFRADVQNEQGQTLKVIGEGSPTPGR